MKILSIHNGHNAAAGFMEAGEMLFAIQEERLTKIKNYIGYPNKAVDMIFTRFNLSPNEIDYVVFNGNHMARPFDVKELKERFKRTQQKNLTSVMRKMARRTPLYEVYKNRTKEERIQPAIKRGFKEKQIKFVEHHLAHASSAYFGSPWWNSDKKVLILTLDGGGDKISATVSIGQKGKIKRISQTSDEDSLGNIYSRITFMLGFTPWEHEYKLMGMAPYVNAEHSKDIKKTFEGYIDIDSKDPLRFRRKINEPTSLIYNRLRNDMELQRFDNICRGLQDFTEELVVKWVKNAIKKTGIHSLALAGGVFMNVKANKRIMELPEVKELFVFPSCGDETNIFGAAWHVYARDREEHGEKIDIKEFGPFYYGTDISNELAESTIKKYAQTHNVEYELREDISEYVGELLANNEIVARASGPMEFGARALGNRSILSNASDLRNVQIINMMVKKRDFWMPFAPVILKERADDYIINPKRVPAPYMILSFDTTDKRDDLVGAIQQADHTARPQVIEKEWNAPYYNILKTFEKETGFGGMMNTSFNLHGYPIVNDAKDALWVFENSGLKYVQIADYIVRKKE